MGAGIGNLPMEEVKEHDLKLGPTPVQKARGAPGLVNYELPRLRRSLFRVKIKVSSCFLTVFSVESFIDRLT